MKLLAIVLGCTSLLGGGFAASFAGADDGPPTPGPPATAAAGSVGAEFVSPLGFNCDRLHWRVGFTLARPAVVQGALTRRVSRTPARWTLVRHFGPRRFPAGPSALELGRYRSGLYRVSLDFRAASGETDTRAMEFRAGCTNAPPPETTPTLPTGPGPRQ